jgi:drug/metabolite transporter (DMT)-like permease
VVLVKAPLGEVDPVTAQAIRLPVAGLLLLPWAWTGARRLRRSDRATMARMVVLSLLKTAGSVLFVAGLKYADVAVAAVLSSTAPMFTIPLGWLFLGERLSAGALAGILVTVAGIVLLQL